jgi:gliding motility-associated lipoprotein GldD
MKAIKIIFNSLCFVFAMLIFFACGSDKNEKYNKVKVPDDKSNYKVNVPTENTGPAPELTKHEYTKYQSNCGFKFDLSKLYKVNDIEIEKSGSMCYKKIDLGKLNGEINFLYLKMQEPLSTYVNYSNDQVDGHKIKANAINDLRIINKKNRVFGTFFELKGDVATPFQFYLTDSTKYFVRGEVLFNCRPNYDSLLPSINYLKTDLLHLIETFEWN